MGKSMPPQGKRGFSYRLNKLCRGMKKQKIMKMQEMSHKHFYASYYEEYTM